MAGGGKIELFRFMQKTYKDVGLLPHQQSNRSGIHINSKNWLILFCLVQFSSTSGAYLLFEANSMLDYGMVFFTCTTVAFCFVVYVILLVEMKNILSYIKNCERLIEKRMHSSSVYKDTNEKIERFSEVSAYIYAASNISLVVLPSLFTTVNYYILDSGKNSFVLFSPTWWPFDSKTPFGYLVAWIGQIAGIGAVVITMVAFIGIGFGSSWLFIVIAKDITNDVTAFNGIVKRLKHKDRVNLFERFRNMIQYYLDAKDCVNDFNRVSRYSLFTFFMWNMVAISSLLVTLQFQLWDENSKMFQTVILTMVVLWIFTFILIVCEPGEQVTYQFDQFSVEFDQCEWNKLSIGMQRMYLIALSDTQQPKNIQSYCGIICTRDTFKQITSKGFSYYMTLRQLGE